MIACAFDLFVFRKYAYFLPSYLVFSFQFYNVYNDKDQELIDVFCGTGLPPKIQSRTNVLLVRFVTDLLFESTGFMGTHSATNGT